ncbi:MAG TPA: MFS transporter [Planctomycetota bacterium]|jgi:AAA family ATP:ADP antiporter|nr:MFS transporter [Planctomycetota bacterium]
MSEHEGGLAKLLRRVVDVHRGEFAALVLSCAYFFCILTSYYVLRPVRDQLGLVGGQEDLAHNFTGTLFAMLLANPLYAWIVTRWPRKRFIPFVYRFFIANLLVFFALMRFGPAEWQIWMSRVFFVWVSVFNLFIVAVFWSLLADLFTLEQGKRLFGLVSVGGSLGAICGSSLTALLAKPLGPVNLLLVSAVLLEVAVWVMRALTRAKSKPEETVRPARRALPEDADQGGVLSGIALVFRSPYLAWICLYMLLGSIAGTILYFEQAAVVRASITDAAERTAVLARIDLVVNIVALSIQLFLTGRIVKKIGIGPTLAIQCTVFGLALAWIGISPALFVVAGGMALFRVGHYATSRPAREALFTVVGREAKYKSKGFIDTFVYRFGDVVGAWLKVGLGSIGGLGTQGIALASLPIAVAWAGVGVILGRKQKALIRRQEEAAPLPAEAPGR